VVPTAESAPVVTARFSKQIASRFRHGLSFCIRFCPGLPER
jgi:hypothetical protein